MHALSKNILALYLILVVFNKASGQHFEHNGQAASWITVNNYNGTGFQTGVRYIPQLLINYPLNDKLKLDGEISADGYLNYTLLPDSSPSFGAKASLYRVWLRLSGSRFEVRAGLQKINFGSALILRPLMWFDRIDPRDPLQLTKGVYGVLGKYYFRNNTNIWVWVLYGNKDPKGWESIPSKATRPEMGGRLQLPVPKGEIAFTYHNRVGEFPEDWQPPVTGSNDFPESRYAVDMKLDLGVGLWFEGSVIHQNHPDLQPFTKSFTLGADYTVGIGNGMNLAAEYFQLKRSDNIFSGGTSASFTGISLSLPLSIITRASAIIFYDWRNNGWYRYANLSFTFDKLAVNLIGFWNAQSFGIFNYDNGPNLFAGAGGQVMVVYNY